MPDTSVPALSAIRCRAIDDADLPAVAGCLARNFRERGEAWWLRGLNRLRDRAAIDDAPRYGVLLEDNGYVAGVLLTIHAPHVKLCNLSSWAIDPDYRQYAMQVDRAATRGKDVTYLNISPAEHTRRLISALGYVSLNEDTVLCAPWLSPPRPGVRVTPWTPDAPLDGHEAQLARDHAQWGWTVLVVTENGRSRPFVFQPKPLPGISRGTAQVLYAPSTDDLARLSGPIGRALLKRGVWLLKFDGAAVPKGVAGHVFRGRSARWAKGPNPPHLNDLSYTELAIFGA